MDAQPASASFEKRTALLLSVLGVAEKRRDAAENAALWGSCQPSARHNSSSRRSAVAAI
jgi:hypothetical protein